MTTAFQIFTLPKSVPLNAGIIMPGAKASFFITETSTPSPVYTDPELQVAHTQPVVADAAGILPTIYLDPAITYKVTLTTAADVLYYTIDPANDQVLSQATIGQLLYPQTAAEIAASVTPVDYAYPAGDSRRQAITNDSSTDHTVAFQALLNGAANADQIHIYKTASSGYIRLTGRVTAPAGTRIVLHDGVEIRWTATTATGSNFMGSATRPGIEVTGDNFRITGHGTIRGPSSGSYVANEVGIYMLGTSTGSRKSGLYVGDGIEILNWGSYGILPMFVDNVDVIGAHVHHCGYIGVFPNSCTHGRIQRNRIHSMTPGTGGEMHGISLSSDTTDYDLDPNASTNGRLAANPFCIDFNISDNTVYDMVSWTGIDAHGCYDTVVAHNKIYNCRRAIQIASSSGDAIAYAGEGNIVAFNTITSRKVDGSATSVAGGLIDGITVNGGATVAHRGVRVIGNDIEGCGSTDNNSGSITCARVREAVILGNTIRNWAGFGIYTFDGDGVMHGNVFGAVSNATAARCIRIDTSSAGQWTISGNRHRPQSGTVAAEGLRITSIAGRHIIQNNDFDSATSPFVGVFQSLSGSGAVSLFTEETRIVTTGSAAALTLANGTEGQEKYLVMTTDGGGDATLTPTNLINGSTITFNDAGDSAFLKFIGGEWCMLGGTATLA